MVLGGFEKITNQFCTLKENKVMLYDVVGIVFPFQRKTLVLALHQLVFVCSRLEQKKNVFNNKSKD